MPNSFAAPTAGNSAFIQLYEQTFPFSPRWFNGIDLVPMAFAGLGGIKQLWNECNRPAPQGLKIVIDAFELLLKSVNVNYSQQSPGNSRALVGGCQSSAANAVPVGRQNQAVAEIQALFQRVADRLHLVIPSVLFHEMGDWVRELLFQHLILTGYWDSVKSFQGVAPIPNPF